MRFSREQIASKKGRRLRQRAPDGSSAIVVGGGIAGLAAATVLAERGVRVTVLEREGFLGGRAGSWADQLADGTRFEMERGFHGFFRQYYNLRSLLRRVDPSLAMLRPLEDYPLLGPNGARESFCGLPRHAPLNLAALVARTDALALRDLPRIDAMGALAMLSFSPQRTYRGFDDRTAREYLDSLRFPLRARQMLFDVFSHSFFNPEEQYSAAELLMMFHLYFLGNPEGLVFDVAREPFGRAYWTPLRAYLEARGVRFAMETEVETIERKDGRFSAASFTADALVLAVTVPALQRIVRASNDIAEPSLQRSVESLEVTRPFAVWRMFMDRACDASRAPFAGTAGFGILDNISLFERFEGESARWSKETGGSVVELHAYAVPETMCEEDVRRALLEGLHSAYPETREMKVVEERFLLRNDCPAFAPGSHALRPGVTTAIDGLALAGDFVKLEFPTALMERAASAGYLAANALLSRWEVEGETLWSVPQRGVLAPPFSS